MKNLPLVQLLVTLGADIDIEFDVLFDWNQNLFESYRREAAKISFLAMAIQYHLPEIVELPLDLGAENKTWEQAQAISGDSVSFPFGVFGDACLPFARYLIHGDGYREAAKRVIHILTTRGHDINKTNNLGYNSLLSALTTLECETYIVEELLAAGASPTLCTTLGDNAASVAVLNSIHRRCNAANIAIVAPHILNINHLDSDGRSAAHNAAIVGSSAMMKVISTCPGFDIDLGRSGRHEGSTALHFAAIFSSAEVASILIKKGAKLDRCDLGGHTPLHTALRYGMTNVADILLEAGAKIFFSDGASVLHAAILSAKFSSPVLRHIVTKHPKLQSENVISSREGKGTTPLHLAATSSDYDAVDALLSFGADHNPPPGPSPLRLVNRSIRDCEVGVVDERNSSSRARCYRCI